MARVSKHSQYYSSVRVKISVRSRPPTNRPRIIHQRLADRHELESQLHSLAELLRLYGRLVVRPLLEKGYQGWPGVSNGNEPETHRDTVTRCSQRSFNTPLARQMSQIRHSMPRNGTGWAGYSGPF